MWLNQVLTHSDYQASIVAHVEPRDLNNLFGNPDYYLGYDSETTRDLLAAERFGAAVEQIMADAAALTLVNAPNIVLTRPGVGGVDPNVVTDSLPLNTIQLAEDAQ